MINYWFRLWLSSKSDLCLKITQSINTKTLAVSYKFYYWEIEMSAMDIEEIFIVEDSEVSLKKLINDAPAELAAFLKDKSVVILPSHGHDDLYYTGTLDTLDFLNENGINAEIYATDDDYKELELRGADIWLGTFIIQIIVLPIFVNVVSSYIYDKIKAKSDDNISLKLMVENKDGKTSAVEFRGKVENLEKAIDAAKGFCNED
ncbi:hypothetical protein HWV03_12345 [Moritella sp. 36]|uniref:hypothetical protein n=1 Tax=Moritella sp. 36 TaxID=2746233 RepID=UPI001BADDE14|nr:hypothetical protein [Moritella sp. 36]QUM89533.1 hypothetical protein HWV03_12345 [Moritella sp. 36]